MAEGTPVFLACLIRCAARRTMRMGKKLSPPKRRRWNERSWHSGIVDPTEHVHQLNSIDGETYQSLLPQPSEGQFRLIKCGGWLKGGSATDSECSIKTCINYAIMWHTSSRETSTTTRKQSILCTFVSVSSKTLCSVLPLSHLLFPCPCSSFCLTRGSHS